MTHYFISRHPGAIAWAKKKALPVDVWLHHLSDETDIVAGDSFYGTLPVNLAAKICSKGGRYFNLSFDSTPELRGIELDSNMMEQLNVRLEEFVITRR